MTVKITITTDGELSRSRFVDRVRAIAGRGRAARAQVALAETPAPDREDVTARRADPLALDPYSPIG
jgi:hypothetical protein